jgi:hypothetical protein
MLGPYRGPLTSIGRPGITSGPWLLADPESDLDLDLKVPVPGDHDLLVRVQAVSVNPVDGKVRASSDAFLS